MKTAACKGSGLMTSLEEPDRASFDLAGRKGARSRYFDFHEGLCEFDTEFAWKVFLLA